jgi:hypothetical protein
MRTRLMGVVAQMAFRESLIESGNDERVRDYEVTFITESGEPNKQIRQRSTARFLPPLTAEHTCH